MFWTAIQTVSSVGILKRPCDVAVVIPTIGRPSLARALRSVYQQQFAGTIQILVGFDLPPPNAMEWAELAAECPIHCILTVFDPGYSTSVRHGGMHLARDGGALRTILSYAAHSRYVAYLDDDNWWHPRHLASLLAAVPGYDWAYSFRWYVDHETEQPSCIDQWESVGPDQGVFSNPFGGFVDPSSLLLDKFACEDALRLWSIPLPNEETGMSSDRQVFAWLREYGRGQATGEATSYYRPQPEDGMHTYRLNWIASAKGHYELGMDERGANIP